MKFLIWNISNTVFFCDTILLQFVLSAIVCLAVPILGKPLGGEEILIIRSESENNGDGTYRYLWETSDGTQVEESGYLKPNGNEDPIQVAQGSFQYYR